MEKKRKKMVDPRRGYKFLARCYFVLGGAILAILFIALLSGYAFSTRTLGYFAVLGLAITLLFMGIQYQNQNQSK
jgi:hypothetical protein